MTPTLEAVLDELEADGLRCASFGVEGGPDGAIVDLWPPVIVWLHPDRVELQADLGATPDENFDYDDAPDPPGDDWSCFDDDGRAWVHADLDAIPENTGALTVRCRALASVASALLPKMTIRWKASSRSTSTHASSTVRGAPVVRTEAPQPTQKQTTSEEPRA